VAIAPDEVALYLYHNLVGGWHDLVVLAEKAFQLSGIFVVHDAKKAA
jgi:hypothetical protein